MTKGRRAAEHAPYRCSRCRVPKAWDAFALFRRSTRETEYACRECKSLNQTTPEKRRESWLRRYYGLTPERYDEMLAAQGGVCGICGEPPGDKPLAVDHDHSCCPGQRSCGECLRGLLCPSCNLKLSLYERFKHEIRRYLHEA